MAALHDRILFESGSSVGAYAQSNGSASGPLSIRYIFARQESHRDDAKALPSHVEPATESDLLGSLLASFDVLCKSFLLLQCLAFVRVWSSAVPLRAERHRANILVRASRSFLAGAPRCLVFAFCVISVHAAPKVLEGRGLNRLEEACDGAVLTGIEANPTQTFGSSRRQTGQAGSALERQRDVSASSSRFWASRPLCAEPPEDVSPDSLSDEACNDCHHFPVNVLHYMGP